MRHHLRTTSIILAAGAVGVSLFAGISAFEPGDAHLLRVVGPPVTRSTSAVTGGGASTTVPARSTTQTTVVVISTTVRPVETTTTTAPQPTTTVPSPRSSVPVSPRAAGGSRCAYAALIRQVWQRDAEWAIGIAWRESRCIPTALNPLGSAGLFQLYRHDDLLAQVCRGVSPRASWKMPACNVGAAWLLYQLSERAYGDGRRPWRL